MTHLTIDQLLLLREPGREPGSTDARAHLEGCAACQEELDRLHQRVARLKALPALRPARDRWPVIRARIEAERRARRIRQAGFAGLAAAASVAAALVITRDGDGGVPATPATVEISEVMARSQALEDAIDRLDPDQRVVDGRTAQITQALEDRIAAVDRELEVTDLLGPRERAWHRLRLWRERVGLLDALVDVHLTRGTNVGL